MFSAEKGSRLFVPFRKTRKVHLRRGCCGSTLTERQPGWFIGGFDEPPPPPQPPPDSTVRSTKAARDAAPAAARPDGMRDRGIFKTGLLGGNALPGLRVYPAG